MKKNTKTVFTLSEALEQLQEYAFDISMCLELYYEGGISSDLETFTGIKNSLSLEQKLLQSLSLRLQESYKKKPLEYHPYTNKELYGYLEEECPPQDYAEILAFLHTSHQEIEQIVSDAEVSNTQRNALRKIIKLIHPKKEKLEFFMYFLTPETLDISCFRAFQE